MADAAAPDAAAARWRAQLEIARRAQHPGDLLVLADEAPTPALRVQAQRAAGAAGRTAAAAAAAGGDAGASAPPVEPRRVVLFAGHRVDAPDRASPRFPPDREDAVRRAIEAELDRLDVDAGDLTLSQAAAGGDLLFVEACQRRGAAVRWLLPFTEAEFVERSVRASAGGERWVARYRAARDALREPPREMPVALGPAPAGVDVWERCNRWLLHTAFAGDAATVHFVCVWDGGGGDGRGGTRHMVDAVRQRVGRVAWIDLRTL